MSLAGRAIAAGGEIPTLRTQTSDTFVQGEHLKTVFSTLPVNYIKNGAWTPIDDRLTPASGGGWSNTADDYTASFPAATGAPVIATKGALSVQSVLVGAAAVTGQMSGDTATYRSVLPGVDETFTTQPDAVEQSFTLASTAAPTTYTQTVTLPAGYTLGQPDGTGAIPITGPDGQTAAALPAPVLTDSSQNPDSNTSSVDATYQVTGTGPTWTVTTTINPAWLTNPARVFPVTLDPTVVFGGTSSVLGCYVTNPGTGTAPSDPHLCSTTTGADNALDYGYTAYLRRLFINFGSFTSGSSPTIPTDAVVTDAEMTLTESVASSATTPMDTTVARAGAWDNTITWATQPGYGAAQAQQTVTPPGAGNTVAFNITELTRAWINGSTPNTGAVIKLTSETSTSNTIGFYGFANAAHHPTLSVTWVPRVGQEKAVGTYDHRLTDRMDLHVNYGDRNLVVNGLDDEFSAPGMALAVRRTYNSELAANGISGAYGLGWSMSGGADTGLQLTAGEVTFSQPGGGRETFRRDLAVAADTSPGAYKASSYNGTDADLLKTDSTHWTLTFRTSQVKDTFTMPSTTATTAYLSSVANRSGNTKTYTSGGTPVQTTKLTDTTGQRSVTFTYTSGRVTGLTETLASGATGARSVSYGYDSSGNLTTLTDQTGKITTFCYTGNLLTRIITPRGVAVSNTCSTSYPGESTDIAYDTGGAVHTITYNNGTASPYTVTFSPDATAGITDFYDAYSVKTQYYYDNGDRITKVLDPSGNNRTATYNDNSDVTASVSAVNYTGGGSDPSSTATFDPNNNPTKTTMPTGASVSANYTSTTFPNQPTALSDDRDSSVTGPAHTTLTFGAYGQVTSASKGIATSTAWHQGDSGVANCGPSGAAAFKGATCEVRDGDYSPNTPTEHRTLYSYDSLGQLVSSTPAAPDHSRATPPAQTIGYDGLSRVTSIKTSLNNTTTFSYDAMDRLTRATYQDGHYTTYTYDEDGDLTFEGDYTSTNSPIYGVGYTYDYMDRASTEQPVGGTQNSVTWDNNSRMLTFLDGSGTTTYGYDKNGSLTSMAQPGGSCTGYSPANPPTTASLCTIFSVDRNGARLATIFPGNLARQTWTYDTSGRITNTTATVNSGGSTYTRVNLGYTYTIAGVDTEHLITSKDNLNNLTTNYTYSNEGWLQSAVVKNSGGTVTNSYTYCYDANGNRTNYQTASGATCPGTANSTWDGANQQLTSPAGGTYGFDLDGNETSSGTGLAGGATRTSTWTNTDQNSTVTVGSGTALLNTYLGASNSYLSTTKLNTTDTETLRNSFTGVSSVTVNNSTTTYVHREPSGNINSFETSNGAHYYPFTDNLGSILFVVDATSATNAAYTYQPYGAQTVTTAPTFTQPFGYTGAYTNPSTGLLHLSVRYYDPTVGRFTQPDPSGQNPGYAYAGDNPVTNTDPTGLSLGSVLHGIGTGIGLATSLVPGVGGLAGGLVSTAFNVAGDIADHDSIGQDAADAGLGIAGSGIAFVGGGALEAAGVADSTAYGLSASAALGTNAAADYNGLESDGNGYEGDDNDDS